MNEWPPPSSANDPGAGCGDSGVKDPTLARVPRLVNISDWAGWKWMVDNF